MTVRDLNVMHSNCFVTKRKMVGFGGEFKRVIIIGPVRPVRSNSICVTWSGYGCSLGHTNVTY